MFHVEHFALLEKSIDFALAGKHAILSKMFHVEHFF